MEISSLVAFFISAMRSIFWIEEYVWPFLCAINGIRDMLNIRNLQFGLEAASDMP